MVFICKRIQAVIQIVYYGKTSDRRCQQFERMRKCFKQKFKQKKKQVNETK